MKVANSSLQEMYRDGLEPTVVTLNSCIKAHGVLFRWAQQKTIKGLKIKMFVGKLVVFLLFALVICLFFVGRFWLAGWARFYFQAFLHLSGFFWGKKNSASARSKDKFQHDKSWWKRTLRTRTESKTLRIYSEFMFFWFCIYPCGLGRLDLNTLGCFFHLRGSFR